MSKHHPHHTNGLYAVEHVQIAVLVAKYLGRLLEAVGLSISTGVLTPKG